MERSTKRYSSVGLLPPPKPLRPRLERPLRRLRSPPNCRRISSRSASRSASLNSPSPSLSKRLRRSSRLSEPLPKLDRLPRSLPRSLFGRDRSPLGRRLSPAWLRSRDSPTAVAATFLPVFSAVRTKSWSPQMTGVELPEPGILIFHRIFLPSENSFGGLPPGATPLAAGPRQAGQFSAVTVLASAHAKPAKPTGPSFER